jgi:hypothetical protein
MPKIEIWGPLKSGSPDYQYVHDEWERIYGHPTDYLCEYCDKVAECKGWIHGKNPHLITSYDPMCRSCHRKYDDTQEWRDNIGRSNVHAFGYQYKSEAYDARRGELNGYHKLTEEDVLKIRLLWATGSYTKQVLGEMFCISRYTIAQVVNRITWKHI